MFTTTKDDLPLFFCRAYGARGIFHFQYSNCHILTAMLRRPYTDHH